MSEKETTTDKAPKESKGKRPYTVSEAALAARRRNAQLSTGPKTEDGKAASRKNAWKHGLYANDFILGRLGKPCQRTCPKYPCSLVDDSAVEPGDHCLDKQYVAEAFDSVIESIQDKKHERFQSMAALEIAGGLDILRQAREMILEEGVIVKKPMTDKDGKCIGYAYLPHPAWAQYLKMLDVYNFTPGDFLMTPKEIAKAKKDDDGGKKETLTDVLAKSIENLSRAKANDAN